eukprot:Partr_v1_DN23959_c0_g1_i1_m48919 putative thioredoxin domain-containing protein
MPSTADLEDDLLAALEREEDDDHEMHRIKERRLEQLRREMNEVSDMKARQHGEYLEVLSEKEILEITTSEKRCVVHFFHNDFRRCQVMDGHLKGLAKKHFKTKFVKVDVENAPFLVTRLQIQILPCVLLFVNGIAVDRVVGFEDLEGTDDFETWVLERKIAACGVIELIKKVPVNAGRPSIYGETAQYDSEDD